ncbi:cupin, partial [Paenarthrobacter sp. NPDC092416]
MIEDTTHESVAASHALPDPTPEEAAQLEQLYMDFAAGNMVPLWTEIGDLMPMVPTPKAVAHVWRWNDLYPLA